MAEEFDDLDIIRAVLDGQVDRYEALVRRHQSKLMKIAYTYVKNQDEAVEMAQLAFVRAYENLAKFRKESQFGSWLVRILVNICNDRLRERSVAVKRGIASASEDVIFEIPGTEDPHKSVTDQQQAQSIQSAIADLSEQQKTVVTLHFFNGMTLEEVSAAMNCKIGTVKTHLFRAYRQLEKKLGRSIQ